MSVICKVTVSEVRDFGGEKLVRTQCVAENEVMAHYNPDAEDKLFSQYSPSGSADFVVPQGVAIPQTMVWNADKLYLMFIESDEEPQFAKSLCFAKIVVKSVTDFGGQSKQFDIGTGYSDRAKKRRWNELANFSHRIMIDNPLAAEQFSPNKGNWWVGIYDAYTHTMSEVISDAHVG